MIEKKNVLLLSILFVFGLSLPALSGSLVFPFSIISRELTRIYAIGLSVFFFLITAFSYKKNSLKKYWKILFTFFIASFVICVDLFINFPATNPSTLVLDMLLSTLIIVIPIIVFTKVSGITLSSIYLKKGKIKLALIIGLVGFLLFWALSIPGASYLFQGQNLTSELVISWMPLLIVVTLANGVREEILYRGIFLKKYEAFFDRKIANFLQAIIFSLSHSVAGLGVSSYTQNVGLLVLTTFFLGLIWGFIMQKTDNVLGAILFHAGTDVAVFIGIFSQMV